MGKAKGYIVRAIFVRDNGRGNLDVASPVEFVASDDGEGAVLGRYLKDQILSRPGWTVLDPLCTEINPALLRAALSDELAQ